MCANCCTKNWEGFIEGKKAQIRLLILLVSSVSLCCGIISGWNFGHLLIDDSYGWGFLAYGFFEAILMLTCHRAVGILTEPNYFAEPNYLTDGAELNSSISLCMGSYFLGSAMLGSSAACFTWAIVQPSPFGIWSIVLTIAIPLGAILIIFRTDDSAKMAIKNGLLLKTLNNPI